VKGSRRPRPSYEALAQTRLESAEAARVSADAEVLTHAPIPEIAWQSRPADVKSVLEQVLTDVDDAMMLVVEFCHVRVPAID